MAQLLSPHKLILAGYIEDFGAGIAVLKGSVDRQQCFDTAVTLCETARDIVFSLGAPDPNDAEYVEMIIAMFHEASELIKPPVGDDKMHAFKDHIKDRATDLSEELADAKKGHLETSRS